MAKNAKPNNGHSETKGITHDEIAKRAYAIYEKNGCQSGHDRENWLAAEAELKAEAARRPRPAQSVPTQPVPRRENSTYGSRAMVAAK